MSTRVGQRYGWQAGEERFLILAPLAFTGGIISCLASQIVIGASGFLESPADAARALDAMVRHRITFMTGVPALWERMASAPGFAAADLSYLRSAGTGGAPVSLALLNSYLAKGVVIRQQYGVSENCGTVCCPDALSASMRPESCGPPVPGVEVEIRDDAGNRVPDGTVGEIFIRGDQIMRGYWNKPEETARAFDNGWYRSGDLGRYDEHGGIIVADRKKNMLISGGVNIYPAEVERGMRFIEGLVDIVVFGLPSERWGQEVVAVAYAPTHAETAAIMSAARELLGPIKAPKRMLLSSEPLPKTVSNKVARTGLEELWARLAGA